MGQNRIVAVILGWCLTVAATLAAMAQYENRPAPSVLVQRPARVLSHPTLVVALHPRCPCSLATVAELEDIVKRSPRPLTIKILAFEPAAAGPEWLNTPTVRSLAQLPGATVIPDREGRQAARESLAVSGEIRYYAAGGELRFQGGVTGSRGHAGPNRAASLLSAVIDGLPQTAALHSPAFGCSLATPRKVTRD